MDYSFNRNHPMVYCSSIAMLKGAFLVVGFGLVTVSSCLAFGASYCSLRDHECEEHHSIIESLSGYIKEGFVEMGPILAFGFTSSCGILGIHSGYSTLGKFLSYSVPSIPNDSSEEILERGDEKNESKNNHEQKDKELDCCLGESLERNIDFIAENNQFIIGNSQFTHNNENVDIV